MSGGEGVVSEEGEDIISILLDGADIENAKMHVLIRNRFNYD